MRDAPHESLPTTVHRIPPSGDRDAPLGLQEIAPAEGRPAKTPVLLLHGATFGSAMFDIPVSGYSFQRFLASRGWRNFALDVRGYGRSVPAVPLGEAPDKNHPYARLDDAVNDLAAGIGFVLAQAGVQSAHIIAFSWGTVVACALASRQSDLVENLVLYAPLYGEVNEAWVDRIADPADRSKVNPRLGAYRWIGKDEIVSRWNADIPKGAAVADYREDAVLDAIIDCLTANDPDASERATSSFRAPTGALVDLFEIFNGRPLYDPSLLTAPTLIIRGQDDTTSSQSDALRLFDKLSTKRKRYVAIAPGSHFLCAEKNARELFEQIDLFLRT